MRRLKEVSNSCRTFFSHPFFWIVLGLKVCAGSIFASHYLKDLFLPFVHYFIASRFADPWSEFLRRGVLDAFPYSSVMLASFTIPHWFGAVLFGGVDHIPWNLQLFLMRVPMLAADLAIYVLLCRWFESKWRSVMWVYWCCPILFYISYIHGQVDSIPTAFLLMSLWLATRLSPVAAGLILAMGLGCKFHLAAAIPLITLYLFKKATPAERPQIVSKFLLSLAAGCAVFIGPLLFSEGYRTLVLGAKETRWVYELSWVMPQGTRILICPLAVMALILHFFSYEKITKDVLILYTGLLYMLLILLVPPAPGWSYWSIPFLCYFLVRHGMMTYLPYWIYNISYLLYFFYFAPVYAASPDSRISQINHGRDLTFTLMQASLALVAIWVYRVGVKAYAKYKIHQKTLTLGIGGDSASGKHTLAETFSALFGLPNVIRLHGDDYHRFPREHEAWKSLTHLDPRSNYVRQPIEHIQELKLGMTITKPIYDHTKGVFTDPVAIHANRVILFEGLHPFVFQRMRDVFDLKVFLATDESLRQKWKLERDMRERGYSREKILEEMQRREEDSRRYIRPQAQFADWVIEYSAADTATEAGASEVFEIKARHRVSSVLVEVEDLMEALSRPARPELSVSWTMDADLHRQVFEVSGRLPESEVERIAYRLFPNLDDFQLSKPLWLPDLSGINQLVLLAFLNYSERR